jgi:hypothetical protein
MAWGANPPDPYSSKSHLLAVKSLPPDRSTTGQASWRFLVLSLPAAVTARP